MKFLHWIITAHAQNTQGSNPGNGDIITFDGNQPKIETTSPTIIEDDARGLLQKAKQITQTKPKVFITDGLESYHIAYKKEFWTVKRLNRTLHIRHIHLKGDMNNNKMERLNGEIRDREKVMRGIKKKDSVTLTS